MTLRLQRLREWIVAAYQQFCWLMGVVVFRCQEAQVKTCGRGGRSILRNSPAKSGQYIGEVPVFDLGSVLMHGISSTLMSFED